MKRIIFSVLLCMFSATIALADHPATGFHVLKTKDVAQLEMEDGKLSAEDHMKLEELSICNGYLEGDSCKLYKKTKDYQTRVKAYIYTNPKDKKEYISYSLSLYSQEDSKNVFRAKGNILYKKELSIKSDRRNNEYTIIFRWEN